MKNQRSIIQINQHKIEPEHVSGEKMLPLKSMCKALGLDYMAQFNKVKNHKILSQLYVVSPMVAADNKEREMLCLPIKATIYWLLSISPNKTHEHFWVLQAKLYDAIVRDFYEKTLFDMQKKLRIDEFQQEIDKIKKEKWEVVRERPDPWNTFDAPSQGNLFVEEKV